MAVVWKNRGSGHEIQLPSEQLTVDFSEEGLLQNY